MLAAFLGKRESNLLPAPFWEWASTERQRIADIYKQGFGSFYSLISKRWSHYNLPDNHNVIRFQWCNSMILNVSAYKTGQNSKYSD